MTREKAIAIAYFKECNEKLVSVAKDENVYDYEKQVIEADCMRRTFEANEKAIKALEQEPETVTEFADRCKECGTRYGKLLKEKSWIPCNEKLPGVYSHVLVTTQDGLIEFAEYCGGYWMVPTSADDYYEMSEILAWQPLPKPYKEDEENETN